MGIKLIHICPTNLIKFVDERYNKGLNMVLTHLVLEDEQYRKEMKALKGVKYLDNSFFELGYCLPPADLIKAAEMVDATHLICPDGTYDGFEEFKQAGYKVMTIPASPEQFREMMLNPEVDLVAVSEEHLNYRHDPGARYELFRDHITPDMPKKKIHLLGATDSLWELGMLSPFEDYIESWDSSAAVWQGHLGNLVKTQFRKDCTSVDFSEEVQWNLFMVANIKFLQEITNEIIDL